jgi:hypothetical protein
VEAFNLANHPNFAVSGNAQSPLREGGNGDTVFKDAAGDFAGNASRMLSTAGTARQVQFTTRLVLTATKTYPNRTFFFDLASQRNRSSHCIGR